MAVIKLNKYLVYFSIGGKYRQNAKQKHSSINIYNFNFSVNLQINPAFVFQNKLA
ncbi:hypothetical protein cpu_16990 [Carboxydothermus pertinax]|uniref:Uncharacterized protein n=1 Tax=Carboxydothermus pertinax TaxID=870242 RepID=A0A1L8CWG0_9THEO|nr:hypothetical protein cpu_16990 [Carboxydothermus pertinax]